MAAEIKRLVMAALGLGGSVSKAMALASRRSYQWRHLKGVSGGSRNGNNGVSSAIGVWQRM